MATPHHRRRRRRLTLASAGVTVAIVFLLLQSLSGTLCASPSRQFSVGARKMRLGGPGSSPPTCRSKCGPCRPCEPVHVPVQPGFSMTLEYYPEAWRCKCGNKLFMP